MHPRLCWYRIDKQSPWLAGTWHMWGQNFVEFENGPGNYPIAIIEQADSSVVKVDVVNVNFGILQPSA